ncbi:MAG: UDP-glucose 4-epimerase [Acidimicrobiaceae bacterium]
MRVVVTGATGNLGTSVLDALGTDSSVGSIVGVARRVPDGPAPADRPWSKVEWVAADVVGADLASVFAGADAVVHLAWLIQPSHRIDVMRATNVAGSERVFAAAGAAGVPTVVYASSVGAYSPGPKERAVDETWPTEGTRSSFYGRHKAEVERVLDHFEAAHPAVRVVRLRPALIFKRESAADIRRLFLGSRFPARLLRPGAIPVVPRTPRLAFQAVHAVDVAEACRLALTSEVRGPFNLAADPVLDSAELGRVLGARPVPVPRLALRIGADVSWRLRLQPTPPGWVDLALDVPVLDCTRARRELDWAPHWSAGDALLDLLSGFADAASGPTPALARRAPPIGH